MFSSFAMAAATGIWGAASLTSRLPPNPGGRYFDILTVGNLTGCWSDRFQHRPQLSNGRSSLERAIKEDKGTLRGARFPPDVMLEMFPDLGLHVRVSDGEGGHQVTAELVDDLGAELDRIKAHSGVLLNTWSILYNKKIIEKEAGVKNRKTGHTTLSKKAKQN
jgi:hypothetical protein